jgi:hypothetical protein
MYQYIAVTIMTEIFVVFSMNNNALRPLRKIFAGFA